jgi:hypothetical protein
MVVSFLAMRCLAVRLNLGGANAARVAAKGRLTWRPSLLPTHERGATSVPRGYWDGASAGVVELSDHASLEDAGRGKREIVS